MNSIILYGNTENTELSNVLINALSENFNVHFIDKDKMISKGNGEIFLITKTNTMKNINCNNSIIIIEDNVDICGLEYIFEDNIVILGDNQLSKISSLLENIINIFICGFGEKNYITFSSRTPETASISIQRAIKIKTLIDIEPCEISCQIKNDISDYNLLCASLALVLILNTTLNLGKNITKIYL